MGGIFSRPAYHVGFNAAVRLCFDPVAGNGHNVILIQVDEGQGTHAAKSLRTDADADPYGYDVRMDI